jgi:hypothetical protein
MTNLRARRAYVGRSAGAMAPRFKVAAAAGTGGGPQGHPETLPRTDTSQKTGKEDCGPRDAPMPISHVRGVVNQLVAVPALDLLLATERDRR